LSGAIATPIKTERKFVIIVVRDLLAAIAGTIRLDLHQLGADRCPVDLSAR
jgi:hypothetical protein